MVVRWFNKPTINRVGKVRRVECAIPRGITDSFQTPRSLGRAQVVPDAWEWRWGVGECKNK